MMTRTTVSALARMLTVISTTPARDNRHPIYFDKPGWYSLDGDGDYRRGTFATTSRIKVLSNER